jgi:hypothetical protein
MFGGKAIIALLGIFVMLLGKGCMDMAGGQPGWIGEPLGFLFLVLPGAGMFLLGFVGWYFQKAHHKFKNAVLAVLALLLASMILPYFF